MDKNDKNYKMVQRCIAGNLSFNAISVQDLQSAKNKKWPSCMVQPMCLDTVQEYAAKFKVLKIFYILLVPILGHMSEKRSKIRKSGKDA